MKAVKAEAEAEAEACLLRKRLTFSNIYSTRNKEIGQRRDQGKWLWRFMNAGASQPSNWFFQPYSVGLHAPRDVLQKICTSQNSSIWDAAMIIHICINGLWPGRAAPVDAPHTL